MIKKLIFISVLPFSLFSANTLTIYNDNFGLFSEKRSIPVIKGIQTIKFDNVASTIDTDSVNLKTSFPINLYTQKYKYDLLNLNSLLKYYINKEISFKYNDEIKVGTLLSINPIIVQLDNDIILNSIEPKNIILKNGIPEEFSSTPSLNWKIESDRTELLNAEITYLISNMMWKAEYTINLDKEQSKLSLNSWINIKNNSGKKFKDIELAVIAGDVNKVNNNKNSIRKNLVMKSSFVADSIQTKHESFGGYHLYKIPFLVDINNNENTQIQMFNMNDINYTETNEINFNSGVYTVNNIKNDKIIEFISKDKVLPKGKIRVYTKDSNKISRFIGEDLIDHTAKSETIKVHIGKDSDIVTNAKILKLQNLSKYSQIKQYKIEIKNTSEVSKNIKIIIHQNSYDVKILSTNCTNECSYSSSDFNTRIYELKIEPKSNFILNELIQLDKNENKY